MANNEYEIAERLMTLFEIMRHGDAIDCAFIQNKFEVSESCARGYLRFLSQMLGSDIVKRRSGRHITYELRRANEPTVADITRAASLRFGEVALEVFRGTKYHYEAQRVSRLERSQLVREAVDDLDRLIRGLCRRTQGTVDYSHKARELEVWLDGIRERRCLHMEYERADGQRGLYLVHPLMLVLYRDRLHLLARRPEDGAHRTFNLDGVLATHLLNESYTPPSPDDCDPRNIYAHSFGIYSDLPPQRVVLHLRNSARVYCEQRPLHPSQEAGPEFPNGWRSFSFHIACCQEFKAFLLGWLPHIRVIEPKELRAELCQVIQAGLESISTID